MFSCPVFLLSQPCNYNNNKTNNRFSNWMCNGVIKLNTHPLDRTERRQKTAISDTFAPFSTLYSEQTVLLIKS